jgi:integrase
MQAPDGNRVNTFLDSIQRGSNNTRKLYRTGLHHFERFLKSTRKQTPNTIISLLQNQHINTYELLDQFVNYLTRQKISADSLKTYIAVIRSFLEYNDIDISNAKFKRKVKMVKTYADPEEPLTLTDIRILLEYNSNHRLRTYILLLVSSGMRAMEACSLRLQDVDFTISPTRITIRREYSKTKRIRTIYCSDEATKHLQKLIEMRPSKQSQDLIFALEDGKKPESLYTRLLEQFQKLEMIADKDQRKEGSHRRKITLHSLRRTAYSIISENTSSDFANWFLGHHHSPYWTHRESERREIYRIKCIPFLTIYQETRDNTIEAALQEKDRTIRLLTNRIANIELHQKETSEVLKHLTPELLERISKS